MDVDESNNFAKLLGAEIVTIVVGIGPYSRSFAIHKTLLCSKVNYFDRMFNGHFQEAVLQKATLPEDDPDSFELFVSWLYQNSIQVTRNDDLTSDMPLLIRLYSFAEKIGHFKLADETIDTIIRICKERGCLPVPEHMELGYNYTHPKSKLRFFLARVCVYVTLTKKESVETPDWNWEFMEPVLKCCDDLFTDTFHLLRELGPAAHKNPINSSLCDFHIHATGEQCTATAHIVSNILHQLKNTKSKDSEAKKTSPRPKRMKH